MHGEYEYEEGVKYSLNGHGGSTLPGSVMLVSLIVLRVLSISSSNGCKSGCRDRRPSMQPKESK